MPRFQIFSESDHRIEITSLFNWDAKESNRIGANYFLSPGTDPAPTA
jgi:hypothetical protein